MSTGTQDDDFVFGVVTRSNAQIMRDQAMHVLTEVTDFAEDEDIVLALHEHGRIRLDVGKFIRPDHHKLDHLTYPNPSMRKNAPACIVVKSYHISCIKILQHYKKFHQASNKAIGRFEWDQVTRENFVQFCIGDYMYSVTWHVKHY